MYNLKINVNELGFGKEKKLHPPPSLFNNSYVLHPIVFLFYFSLPSSSSSSLSFKKES
jgi:hypothetical protein